MSEINETETLRWHLKVLIDEYLKTDGGNQEIMTLVEVTIVEQLM